MGYVYDVSIGGSRVHDKYNHILDVLCYIAETGI